MFSIEYSRYPRKIGIGKGKMEEFQFKQCGNRPVKGCIRSEIERI